MDLQRLQITNESIAGQVSEAVPAWEILLLLPDGSERKVVSSSTAFNTGRTADDGLDIFSWTQLGEEEAKEISVYLTRRRTNAGSAWKIRVENQGQAALLTVAFPCLAQSVSATDQIVIPIRSGRLQSADQEYSFRGMYPSGLVSTQCAGIYGEGHGLYVGMHDPQGSMKELEVECRDGQASLRWTWPVPDMRVPGAGWEMPGEVAIESIDGDWFNMAQTYRAWAENNAQWWPRGSQAGRPDTPDWFKDNPFWLMVNGWWPHRNVVATLDEVVEKIKRFADALGEIPFAVHWYRWNEVPLDTLYPQYFPAKEGFAEAVREVQRLGIKVMPYINAHLWDTALDNFPTLGQPAACKSFDGTVQTKTFEGHTFACVCPTAHVWTETISDIVMRLTGPEFNVDGVYLDQVSAVWPILCFDKSHGHALGGGSWWTTEGYWPMLDQVRKTLRNRYPEKVLTSESNAEPYVSRLDGYLTWVTYSNGTEAIPLHHAIYSGAIQFFGRLYKWDSWHGLPMRMKMAQALVWGEQLGWISPDVLEDASSMDFLKCMARLRQKLLRYLARGRMACPPALETDGATVTANWVFVKDLPVTTPAVLSGAWYRDDSKAIAFTLVNVDELPHTVELEFDAASYGLDGELTMQMWTGEESAQDCPATSSIDNYWRRSICLEPMKALAIEITGLLP